MEQTDLWRASHRLTAVVGHFGSGKTEFAVNLALSLAADGLPATLADLDVVDPYFRSRERADLLERAGVELITTSQACMDADVPSLPPEVMSLFDNSGRYGVLDIGGDPSGARVLVRYRRRFQQCGGRTLCVVNANRPLTDTPDRALDYLERIRDTSGLPIDGLVNNTHLCHLTRGEDILAGARLAEEVSRRSGVPVVCHAVPAALVRDLPALSAPVFPMELYMKKPWE